MSIDAWWTLAVVVVTIALLATERVAAPVVVMGAVTVLLVTGVVDVDQAMSGFANEAPLTIAALYVVTGAAERTGALDALTRRFIGSLPRQRDQRRATRAELTRLLLPATAMSAFIYNTPTVALLAPQTATWARRSGRSPSWYLLALDYAVILAGLLTAIGTTTNVIVSGLLTDAHQRPLGLFEISPVGLAVTAVGLVAIVGLGGLLTPSRQAPSEYAGRSDRDYTVEMVVAPGSAMVGRSVAEAGLRNLDGVFLVQIATEGRTLAPVAPTDELHAGDRLTFAGNVERVVDLHRLPGLLSAESAHLDGVGKAGRTRGASAPRFFETVVGVNSPLVGATLKEVGFRGRYDAAVLAIHRSGERLAGQLGGVRLRAGDLLLVLADANFPARWANASDFSLLAALDDTVTPPRGEKAWIVGAALIGFLLAAATGVLSVLEAALVAALAVVATGAINPTEARRAVNLDVLVVLGGSFGIGAAIAASGLARHIADGLVNLSPDSRPVQIAAVLVATVLLTQVVTNNAAAIVMFPIAMATASSLHTDPRAFAIAVAVGASCSFLTPIGYQTNMMVQGIGGYRFADFLPLGSVLVVTTAVTAALLIPVVWPG